MKKDKIVIGKLEGGGELNIDLPVLLRTRMLITANSGAGKSYCIRKLLEETHGKVQQIVLDLEGEFATLREKFDYLLVGKDGDIPIDIKGAELLAKKLLELNVSAIIDLYELKHHERIIFVKRFLDSMINAKKELWHPCLVIVDEAHQFCPQKEKAESTGSVIDLMTRGRKRGFCGILTTQRPSKLHKDAAAEASNNILAGRVSLDVDMKRVSEWLGFTSKEQMFSLRDLYSGEFYSIGSALSNKLVKVKIDKVMTTHPEAVAGMGKIITPAPATNKIKSILSKLTDLPQKAEDELREMGDYKRKIRELKSQLRKQPAQTSGKDVKMIRDELKRQYDKAILDTKNTYQKNFNTVTTELNRKSMELENLLKKIVVLATIKKSRKTNITAIFDAQSKTLLPPSIRTQANHIQSKPQRYIPTTHAPTIFRENKVPDDSLKKCARKVLSLLYNNPNRKFSKQNAALFTGYSHKSGGFNNAISQLSSMGVIKRAHSELFVDTDKDSYITELLGDDVNLYEEFTIANWCSKLPRCERKIFKLFLEDPLNEYSKERLGEETGYQHSSGGFNNALSRLNSLGLIKREEGLIKINKEILES